MVQVNGEAAVKPQRPGNTHVVHPDALAGVSEVLGHRGHVITPRLPQVAVEWPLDVVAGRMSTGNTRMPARA